jgi:hypothetical protein
MAKFEERNESYFKEVRHTTYIVFGVGFFGLAYVLMVVGKVLGFVEGGGKDGQKNT